MGLDHNAIILVSLCTFNHSTFAEHNVPFSRLFQHWGFSRFTANATTLVFEYVRDDDGQVHDTVVFTK